jgi:hypothetical protein
MHLHAMQLICKDGRQPYTHQSLSDQQRPLCVYLCPPITPSVCVPRRTSQTTTSSPPDNPVPTPTYGFEMASVNHCLRRAL